MTANTATRRVSIVNEKGLHARPSAALARLAGQYASAIRLSCAGQEADALSIMDLLMLIAHCGSAVDVRAEGPDAEEAADAVAALIADGFGEPPAVQSDGQAGSGQAA